MFDEFPSLGQMEVIFCPSCPRVPRLVSAVISSPVVSNICFCHAAELNLFLLQERRRWVLLCVAILFLLITEAGLH